jgi:uncharacterized protein (DUF58 family)
MGFRGEKSKLTKLEYGSFFAACLAWLVQSGNDRTSLMLFDEGVRKFHPPGSTRRHLNEMLSSLEANEAGSGTSIIEALRRAQPLLRRRGTLVLLSDFFCDPAELFRSLNPYLHRGFRVHLFHLLDPEEIDLGDRGLSKFVDMETGDRMTAHPQALRDGWKTQMQNHTRALRSLAASRGADYMMAPTSDTYFTMLDRLRS